MVDPKEATGQTTKVLRGRVGVIFGPGIIISGVPQPQDKLISPDGKRWGIKRVTSATSQRVSLYLEEKPPPGSEVASLPSLPLSRMLHLSIKKRYLKLPEGWCLERKQP